MTLATLVLLCLLAAVIFIGLGALVELFRQVQQIRRHLDLDDRPTPLDLGRLVGKPATTVGLPAELDRTRAAMVLFLTSKCATCRSIAAAFKGAVPLAMWVVVEPVSGDDADLFVEEFRLLGERTVVDRGGRIADRLGLDVTPSAVLVDGGRLQRAETVPSSRQAFAMLPLVRPLREPKLSRSGHDDFALSMSRPSER